MKMGEGIELFTENTTIPKEGLKSPPLLSRDQVPKTQDWVCLYLCVINRCPLCVILSLNSGLGTVIPRLYLFIHRLIIEPQLSLFFYLWDTQSQRRWTRGCSVELPIEGCRDGTMQRRLSRCIAAVMPSH